MDVITWGIFFGLGFIVGALLVAIDAIKTINRIVDAYDEEYLTQRRRLKGASL